MILYYEDLEKKMIKKKLIVIKLKNLYNDDPVDRIRGINVVKALKKRGWNIEIFNNQKNIDLIIYLDDYNLYDRVIFEYTQARFHVIDIQDNHINRNNPASVFIKSNQRLGRLKRMKVEMQKGIIPFIGKMMLKKLWYWYYIYSIRKADHILCSSNSLKGEYQKYNSKIAYIPDAVEDFVKIELPLKIKVNKIVSLCWVGTENNIVYLGIIDKVLARLQEKYTIEFTIICSKNIFLDKTLKNIMKQFSFTYNFVEWKKETVLFELNKHDIAVAPLPIGTEKSTNKILTYMAAGVAVICSGASDYLDLYNSNPKSFDFISDNEEHGWMKRLEKLIVDVEYRNEKIQNGYKLSVQFSINAIVPRYEIIFHELLMKDRI